MLEWLKTILGDTYNEDTDKKVSEEIGKSFVSRGDFNTTNGELKTARATITERDGQLEALKTATGDVAALKEQITALQTQNAELAKTHENALKQLKIDNAVEAALAEAKAKNPKAVRALLELDKAELAEDGTVKGLAEQLKTLAEAEDSGFLFGTAAPPAGFKGLKPADGKDRLQGTAKSAKDMSYDELCSYMAAHPEVELE
ncbi:MAG: phage scaffolding protein [Oscillospiraceae bacterium]